MTDLRVKRILADCSSEDFIGRSGELDLLRKHAAGDKHPQARVITAAPFTGVSELLKQTYDLLFREQNEVIPFYFEFNQTDRNARQTALRFVHEFLLQTVAFRRRDHTIIQWLPDLRELSELALPADGHWIDRLVEFCMRNDSAIGEDAFLNECMATPLRAVAGGARIFVMIDGCHEAARSEAGKSVFEAIKSIYRRSTVPYVLAGRRRFQFDEAFGEKVSLEPISFHDAGLLAERLAKRHDVEITDESRDLIAVQLGANPIFMRSVVQAAAENGTGLTSFQSVQQMYAREVFGGRIAEVYEAAIREAAGEREVRDSIISLLDIAVTLGKKQLSVDSWRERLGLSEPEFSRILDFLHVNEMIRLTANQVEAMDGNDVLTDYVAARFRLEVVGENRASLYGESVLAYLTRAPRIMARFYRRSAAVGLRDLLERFTAREIPRALIDYRHFSDRIKGQPDKEVLSDKENSIRLPSIIYSANTADYYKPIDALIDRERSAIGIGIERRDTAGGANPPKAGVCEDEVVWLAAEIDSKLEASAEHAEFWCDRLEMAALSCGFVNYRLWLIAPEGFSPDAMDVIEDRAGFGSSRRQIGLLREFLSVASPKVNVEEYEMIVPMSGDSELIAARAIEEIAKRHQFGSKAINQIKTAMVEASINAAEHSLSPDGKIYHKFAVNDDRIVITVSNRGLRIADKNGGDRESETGRRGWGLKLIDRLMDKVEFEHADDGTRISMTKFLVAQPRE